MTRKANRAPTGRRSAVRVRGSAEGEGRASYGVVCVVVRGARRARRVRRVHRVRRLCRSRERRACVVCASCVRRVRRVSVVPYVSGSHANSSRIPRRARASLARGQSVRRAVVADGREYLREHRGVVTMAAPQTSAIFGPLALVVRRAVVRHVPPPRREATTASSRGARRASTVGSGATARRREIIAGITDVACRCGGRDNRHPPAARARPRRQHPMLGVHAAYGRSRCWFWRKREPRWLRLPGEGVRRRARAQGLLATCAGVVSSV